MESSTRESCIARARAIKCIMMDVDGVLTDGRIYFGGPAEGGMRAFHAHDGQGITRAQQAGLMVVWVSGRTSAGVSARAAELGIPADKVFLGRSSKLHVYETVAVHYNLAPAQICYIGDDSNDAPVLARAGLAIAPASAHPEARRHAHLVTGQRGGEGAVREAIDFILAAQGKELS